MDINEIRKILEDVKDPEIPVLTARDLGIIQDIQMNGDQIEVKITPTYSGCPAMKVIEWDIIATLKLQGFENVRVVEQLSPPWTTDMITEEGLKKLKDFGIAPPSRGDAGMEPGSDLKDGISCPRCGSTDTKLVSAFGSTACKAHYTCRSCLEPFDYFKCLK